MSFFSVHLEEPDEQSNEPLAVDDITPESEPSASSDVSAKLCSHAAQWHCK